MACIYRREQTSAQWIDDNRMFYFVFFSLFFRVILNYYECDTTVLRATVR